MTKWTVVIASLGLSVAILPGIAQGADSTATPVIDKRLENQERRIEKGKETGQLTEREAARLEKRHDRIESHLEKARADGVVTNKERAKLHHQLDHSSAAIAKQKHDRQHDYNHDGKTDRPRKK